MRSTLFLFIGLIMMLSCNRKSSGDLSKDIQTNTPDTISNPASIDSIETKTIEPPAAILPDTVISYQRSGCFGTCPVYSFILFEDGSAQYNGTAHTKWIGRFNKTLDSTQIQGLLDLIDVMDLHRFRGDHPTSENEWILDLPTTTLVSKRDTLDRVMVRNNHSAPKAYRDFEKTLRLWIESIDWSPANSDE